LDTKKTPPKIAVCPESLRQGCGLRKIKGSLKVPNHEILGAQHLSLYEKSEFVQLPKGES